MFDRWHSLSLADPPRNRTDQIANSAGAAQLAQARGRRSGTIYVISSPASLGSDVWKIGMTQMSNPHDRISCIIVGAIFHMNVRMGVIVDLLDARFNPYSESPDNGTRTDKGGDAVVD